MKTRSLVVVFFGIAGLLAGYLSGDFRPVAKTHAVQSGEPTSQEEAARDLADQGIGAKDQQSEIRKQLFIATRGASSAHRIHDLAELFETLSLPAVRMAIGLIEQLPRDSRREARFALVMRLFELSPDSAKEYAAKWNGYEDNLPYSILQAWRKTDPGAALCWFLQTGENQFQRSWVLKDIPESEFAKAIDQVLASPHLLGSDGVKTVFERLAKEDPESALSRAAGLENLQFRRTAMQAAVRSWAAARPDDAMAWFDQLADEDFRRSVAPGLAVAIFSEDPEHAMEIAQSLPEGSMRADALLGLVEAGRYSKAHGAAIKLLDELPFEAGSKIEGIYYSWLMDDPGKAMLNLLERLNVPDLDSQERLAVERYLKGALVRPDMYRSLVTALAGDANSVLGESRSTLLEANVCRWAESNSEAARQWVDALPEGGVRNHAMAGAIKAWAWSAPKEAAAWLDQQAPSSALDCVVSGYVTGAFTFDPDDALRRLRTINNGALRQDSLKTAWMNWCKRDQPAAEAWRDHSARITNVEKALLVAPSPSQ